jgi:hypothetical protein
MGITDTVFGKPPQTTVQFAPGFRAPGFGFARSLADYLSGLIGQPGPEYQGQLDPGLSPTLANLGQMMQGYATSPAPYIMGQAAGTLGAFMNPAFLNPAHALSSPGTSYFGGAAPGGRPGVMPGSSMPGMDLKPLPGSPPMPGAPTGYPGAPQIPPGIAGALPGALGGHSGPFSGIPSVFQSGPLQALLSALKPGGLQFQPGGPLMGQPPTGGEKPLNRPPAPSGKPPAKPPAKPNKPNGGRRNGGGRGQAGGASLQPGSGGKPGANGGNTKPLFNQPPNNQPPQQPNQPFGRKPFGGGGGVGGGRG